MLQTRINEVRLLMVVQCELKIGFFSYEVQILMPVTFDSAYLSGLIWFLPISFTLKVTKRQRAKVVRDFNIME